MNIIVGKTDKISNNEVRTITVNGKELVSDHHLEHGCSFNWGYHGHGSRYLAEALMINLGYTKEFAANNMTKVSEQIISGLADNWQFTDSELKARVDQVTAH